MDPFQVPQKVSIAPFPIFSPVQILTYIARFSLFSSTKNILLQNVLALLAPPVAKFLYQPPNGPWCPIPAATLVNASSTRTC